MAVEMLGRRSTDNDSPVCSDVGLEAYTTLEIKTNLLRKTAKQIGVKLQGQLALYQGCSEAKGARKPVKSVTHTRAVKPAERFC